MAKGARGRRSRGALRRLGLSRSMVTSGNQGGKRFTPRLDQHLGRIETLRAMGLVTVDNTAVVRTALDDYIERMLAKVNLNVLDLDQIAALMATGEVSATEALKRVGIPGHAWEPGKRKGDEKR